MSSPFFSDKKNQGLLGIKVNVDNNDLYKWDILIDEVDPSEDLGKDMLKYNVDSIKLEVTFPKDYPFTPPFVRVITPRFKYMTGHVTLAGAICMEVLTTSGWTPGYSIESLIIQIKSELSEGGGRLDPQKHNMTYGLKEAQSSFIRVAKGHGWL